MSNPVNLSNIKVDITKKSFHFTKELTVNGVALIAADTNTHKVSVAANQDMTVTYNAPAPGSISGIIANGTEVTLNWKLKRDKTAAPDSKTYDKSINIPLGRPIANFTVELGKIGRITFTGEAPSSAEQKKREEAERIEKSRLAEQQKQDDERRRLEAETAAAAQAEAAAKAEHERVEQERIAAENARLSDPAFLQKLADLDKENGELRRVLEHEVEYAYTNVVEQLRYIMTVREEERQAALRELMYPSRGSWPVLNPELRIAKLFQDPVEVEHDPVFEAICAKPTMTSTLNSAPPAATNSTASDIYTQTTIAPDPYSMNRRNNNLSPTPARNNNNKNNNINSNKEASVSPPNNHQFNQRMTPLDILHDKNSDPNQLNKKQENNPQKFGASNYESDFSRQNQFCDESMLDDPAFQPPEKFYRMAADKMQNPLRQCGTGGIEDLPPLETLHQFYSNRAQQKQDNINNNSVSDAMSPKRNVTFSDQPQRLPVDLSASPMSRPGRFSFTGNNNANTTNSNKENTTKMSEKEVRYEMDLEPPPALMTALLHLSRDGGNLNSMIPIEHQGTLFNKMNGSSASPSPGRQNLNASSASPSGGRFGNNSPSSNNQSPSRGQQQHHHGENAMTPRRKLPLVYTNIGEVVSKTRRHDDRAAPSFMRDKEIRFQTADPAQSYWNCFAPQKAQNLVGVRMANTVVAAFEEAATVQVAAASPPKRVTGVVPNAPRNLRTSSPPMNTMRIFDGGESSASRAHRRW